MKLVLSKSAEPNRVFRDTSPTSIEQCAKLAIDAQLTKDARQLPREGMGKASGTPARTRTGAHGLGNRCSILLSYRGMGYCTHECSRLSGIGRPKKSRPAIGNVRIEKFQR